MCRSIILRIILKTIILLAISIIFCLLALSDIFWSRTTYSAKIILPFFTEVTYTTPQFLVDYGSSPQWIIFPQPYKFLAFLVIFILLSVLYAVVGLKVFNCESLLRKQLAVAIKNGDIIPWYQPIICGNTGRIYGVEILARWNADPDMMISPDVFIPLAEETGLIIPLTQKLLDQVARDLVPVITSMPFPFHVSINIGKTHIHNDRIAIEDFKRFISSFPQDKIVAVVELTEREPLTDIDNFTRFILQLKELGCKLALDDFGTGYSNFVYLNNLSMDIIKIDQEFIRIISSDNQKRRLTECVIDMANAMEMQIIAEGVETEYQVSWLTSRGVSCFQGYYFSPPLPITELAKKLTLH